MWVINKIKKVKRYKIRIMINVGNRKKKHDNQNNKKKERKRKKIKKAIKEKKSSRNFNPCQKK